MSYLLEALQKSEQERQQQPGAATLSAPPAEFARDDHGISPWIFVAIAALLINTALVIWLALRQDTPAAPPTVIVQPIQVPAPASTATNTAHATATDLATDMPANAGAEENSNTLLDGFAVRDSNSVHDRNTAAPSPQLLDAVNTPAKPARHNATANGTNSSVDAESAGWETISPSRPRASLAASDAPVISANELPADLRARLPVLSMQSHLFAEDARNSSVMINDRHLTPGDHLTDDIQLETVVEKGAILRIGEHRVLLPALGRWQP